MVASAAHIELNLIIFIEDWCDDRDVWQVVPPCDWVVRHHHFIFLPVHVALLAVIYLELHGFLHAAEMHWDVRGVGDEASKMVKNSTREVKSLFDVCADTGALQSLSHGFCDRHKPVAPNADFAGVLSELLYVLLLCAGEIYQQVSF